MGETFFISDLHLGHANCLGFDNRPFNTIAEQDEEIIKRWNQDVGKEDTVWILGDISWYNPRKTAEIIGKLNGRKNLCIGNHDGKLLKSGCVKELFDEIRDYKELQCCGHDIVLSHYPIPCYKNHFYDWLHFYGHTHTSFEWNMMERVRYEMISLYGKSCEMINVGCMLPYMDYTPRTAEDILSGYNRYKELTI